MRLANLLARLYPHRDLRAEALGNLSTALTGRDAKAVTYFSHYYICSHCWCWSSGFGGFVKRAEGKTARPRDGPMRSKFDRSDQTGYC